MNITITGRRVDVTQPVRSYAEDKINKALKYSKKIMDVHVIMSTERYLHTVQIAFNLGGETLFAKESSGDMYSSINLATEKIVKQLRRYRDRLKSHKVRTKMGEEKAI